MLNFVLIFSKSFKKFFLNIRPVDVDWFLYGNFDGNFPVNMNWNLTIDVDWFVYIYDFLSYSRYLDSLNDFSRNLVGYFFLNLDVFRNLNYLLDDSLRPRYRLGDLNDYLNWFLHVNLFNYLFGHDRFMSFNLAVSVFQNLF